MATIKKQLTLTFKQPNIAESYGPYTSKSAAHAALSEDQLNVIGMTVGIQTSNTIEEYWYQGGTTEQHLVKKQTVVEVDATPTQNSPNAVSSGGVKTTLDDKQNTISDLSTIRSGAAAGATALQPVQNATPNNFAIFDSNGDIKDSGCNEDTFIKGVQQNGVDLQKDSNGKVNVTVQDGQNGLSAFEIAQQQGYTGTVDQWLASLKANIGAFKFVSYDQSAESAFTTGGIGTTYSNTIDGLVAGTDTTPDVILLMNNTDGTTDPTKTFMIATQETTTVGTYEFIYAGDLQSAIPSNVLTEDDIDGTHLVNPVADSLVKAEDALQLKTKLNGVTASETKIGYIDGSFLSNHYVGGNGSTPESSSYDCATFDVEGYKNIRFLGVEIKEVQNIGYAFYDSDGVYITDTYKKYDVSGDGTIKLKEYIVTVPQDVDAKYLKITIRVGSVLTSENFYCYLQNGESVVDLFKNVYEFNERIEPDVVACKKAYDNLQFGNNAVGSPIVSTDEFTGLIINNLGNISTGTDYQKIYCYPTSSIDRYVYVDLYVYGTSTMIGGVWLIDDITSIVDGGNISTSNCLNTPKNINSGNSEEVKQAFFVPANKILIVTYSIYQQRSYLNVYETEYNSQVIADIQDDVAELQDAFDETTIDGAKKGNEIYDDLQYGYYGVGEPITETNVFSSIYIKANNKIGSTTSQIWKIYCYPTSTEDRWLYVDEFLKGTSSLPTGGVYLIDDVSFIVDGNTIPSEDVLNACSTQSNRVLQKSFFVPANRILVVTHSTYMSDSFLNVYETEFSSKVIDDIQDDITELQDNIDTTVINSINGNLSVDAIPSSTNPLAFVKETAGYTSIFRKMGVIGGSMSTGWHSHNTGSVSANMPEYSYLQFMARLCSSEGHNFSRGGMSAKSWPANDMMEDFYDTNKKCQMYIIQLGNNDLAYHSGHSDYTLGTVSDLTPISGSSIEDYTYNTNTFYGNMARIINEVRKVQPRAYMFLSTFLKGYGTVPSDFDYNVAIRNIVDYYSDSSNRPTGDELHYYLIDIYEYGQPYSFYSTGIHEGTVKGSHLVATGYNYWAYEFCTYIDWIIKNNMSDFNDVAFVGTDNYN